jgi:hypothetical protein
MTDAEILAVIDVNPAVKALADAGNDAGCAFALVPLLPPVTVSREVTLKQIMTAFPTPDAGWAVISKARAATSAPSAPPWLVSALAWLDPATANAGLDFGEPIVRQQIQSLGASGVLTASEVATLLALAEQPYPLTGNDVSRIYAGRRAR